VKTGTPASGSMDVLVDGNLLIIASGRFVHLYSLANPAVPALLADVDLSTLNSAYRVYGIAGLLGSKLILAGRRSDDTQASPVALAVILDLSSLYDSLVSTRPSAADATVLQFAYGSRGAVLSRDRLVFSNIFASNNRVVQIQDGIDNNAGTLWDGVDIQSVGTAGLQTVGGAQTVSGNLLFSGVSLQISRLRNIWASGSLDSFDIAATPSSCSRTSSRSSATS